MKYEIQKFEALFREHFTGLTYFAQKYLGDMDSSKEIVHAVFVKIWENRHEFEWEKPAKSYLFTSVYNRSMNYIRDNKKFTNPEDEEAHEASLETGEFTDTMEFAELEGKIKQAIAKLPEKCRERDQCVEVFCRPVLLVVRVLDGFGFCRPLCRRRVGNGTR